VWDGHQKRDFTFVDDAVGALLLAVTHPEAAGRVFNVGGEPVVSLTELAELLVEVAGAGRWEAKSFPAERKQIDIGDYYADDRLLRNGLGWAPAVTLREGLRRTVDYYRECLPHYL
jgi:UDP-glucose 4-epimerase